MLVEYVDDVYLQAPTDREIDTALADVKQEGLDFNDAGCLSDYLGLEIHRTGNSFHVKQTGLIDKLLVRTMQMENCSPNACPLNAPVGRHADHPPHSASWDVPTVLGMMTYISMQTHPEISTAVNMIANQEGYCTRTRSIYQGVACPWPPWLVPR